MRTVEKSLHTLKTEEDFRRSAEVWLMLKNSDNLAQHRTKLFNKYE